MHTLRTAYHWIKSQIEAEERQSSFVPLAHSFISTLLRTLRITYHWIKSQIEAEERQSGFDRSKYSHSMVVGTLKPTDLGSLRQQDGQETFEEKK